MALQQVTLRNIDGEYYSCIDIGVDDLEKARLNRERVKLGKENGWYNVWDNFIAQLEKKASKKFGKLCRDISYPCHAEGYNPTKDKRERIILGGEE